MAENNAPAKRGRAAESIASVIATDLLNPGFPTRGNDQKTGRILQVFVVHEDYSAGLRAKEAFNQVGSQLDLPHSFDLELWRTALLEDFGLRKAAERLAARADIIFMSFRGDRPLSLGFRAWLVYWTMQREQRPCVLVASFDERFRCSRLVLEILQDLVRVAAPQGLQVILHFDSTPIEVRSASTAAPVRNPPLSILSAPQAPSELSPSGAQMIP
jgi:hypothetical protein